MKLFWPVGVEIIDSVGTRGVLLSLSVASNLVFDSPKFVAKGTASFEDWTLMQVNLLPAQFFLSQEFTPIETVPDLVLLVSVSI